MASPEARQILIKDFGYQPVDIESESAYSRAVRETVNKLKLENPKDPRIKTLQDAVRPSRKRKQTPTKKETPKKKETTTKKETPKKRETFLQVQKRKLAEQKAKSGFKGSESAKIKKDDAVKFITGKTPEPVEPTPPPMPKFGGAKTGAALTSISQTVNAIKKLVTRQNKFEKDKADDTREAREKKKRSMKENLMEGGKKAFGAVKKTFGKVLEPAKGIFESIFGFITKFLLGAALMKILDWFGNPDNKSKIESIFKFLKDFWPVIVTALMAFVPGFPIIGGVIALAVGFLPKIINLVKSILGLGKDVDKEIKKNEKELTGEDTTTVTTENTGKTTAFAEDAEGNEITDLDERKEISDRAREAMPMNKGGEVPGQGDKDTVPAMLTPGEFVLTKDAVKKYGTDTLYGMNAAAGGVGKSNDVPRGPSGKPMKKTVKKKSTIQTMMDMGGLNPINNISKSMSNVTNNTSNDMSKSMSNVTNNTSNNMSKSMSNVTNNSLSDVTNNKSNVTNKTSKTINMSSGGMTKNMSYMGGGGMTKNSYNSGGMVTNNIGGTSNTQYMKLGGMVKNFISKTPQARLIRFAAKQIKKSPVGTPISKTFKKLRMLGSVPPAPSADMGDPTLSGETIPKFSVIAPGGRAKEQTLGVRR